VIYTYSRYDKTLTITNVLHLGCLRDKDAVRMEGNDNP